MSDGHGRSVEARATPDTRNTQTTQNGPSGYSRIPSWYSRYDTRHAGYQFRNPGYQVGMPGTIWVSRTTNWYDHSVVAPVGGPQGDFDDDACEQSGRCSLWRPAARARHASRAARTRRKAAAGAGARMCRALPFPPGVRQFVVRYTISPGTMTWHEAPLAPAGARGGRGLAGAASAPRPAPGG